MIKSSYVLIQPITTLPSQRADLKTWIEVGNKAIPRENWSAVINPESKNPKFLFKNLDAKDDRTLSNPFTGIINAPTHIVQQIINTDELYGQLKDKTDLWYLAKKIWQIKETEFRLTEWYDLGHYSTYSQTSVKRLESRSFNYLKICNENNIICKSSIDFVRLRAEASYLENIDNNIKRFSQYFFNIKKTSSEQKFKWNTFHTQIWENCSCTGI